MNPQILGCGDFFALYYKDSSYYMKIELNLLSRMGAVFFELKMGCKYRKISNKVVKLI